MIYVSSRRYKRDQIIRTIRPACAIIYNLYNSTNCQNSIICINKGGITRLLIIEYCLEVNLSEIVSVAHSSVPQDQYWWIRKVICNKKLILPLVFNTHVIKLKSFFILGNLYSIFQNKTRHRLWTLWKYVVLKLKK